VRIEAIPVKSWCLQFLIVANVDEIFAGYLLRLRTILSDVFPILYLVLFNYTAGRKFFPLAFIYATYQIHVESCESFCLIAHPFSIHDEES